MRIFAAELCGNRSGGAKVRLQHLLRSASNPLHYSLAQKVRIRNVFPFSTSQGFKFEPLLPPGFFCATYLGINMCVLLNAPSPPTPYFRSLQNLRLQRDPTNIGVLREEYDIGSEDGAFYGVYIIMCVLVRYVHSNDFPNPTTQLVLHHINITIPIASYCSLDNHHGRKEIHQDLRRLRRRRRHRRRPIHRHHPGQRKPFDQRELRHGRRGHLQV